MHQRGVGWAVASCPTPVSSELVIDRVPAQCGENTFLDGVADRCGRELATIHELSRIPDYDVGTDHHIAQAHTAAASGHRSPFLGEYGGALMVDDYVGYKAMFAAGMTELGCWAHARRKFVDQHKASGSAI